MGRLGADRVDGDEEAEELVGGRHGHVEGQHLQEHHLHAHQLLLFVGAVRDVHKVLHLGRVDLLVLPAVQQWRPLKLRLLKAAVHVKLHLMHWFSMAARRYIPGGVQ